MPDSAPLRIGKYEITDFLGKGAMGVVYRGLDPLLNRYVAIKVMSQGIATDKDLRDRFMREARAAGSLQHPNISTIYDFGEADGSLYIAMEYIEGSDLSDIIERRDPIPLTGKIDIIVDALHALDYAHSRGVVHRDVKPANIRVSVDGHAKLMDFGIARLEKSNLTKSGMMIGTPDYMAPEQVTGGSITGATDVFAVGVVLYEFLTNHRTFDGDTIHAVLYKVVSEQPPRLRDVSSQIPGALQPILDRALAKDPAHRYPTAGAMARDLASVRTAQGGAATITVAARATPLRTQRISAPQLVAKKLSRRPVMWAGAGAAVLALGVAGVLYVGGHRQEARPPVGASPAPAATAPPVTVPAPGAQPVDSLAARAAATPTVSPPTPQPESAAQPTPVPNPKERSAPHLGGARTALADFGRRRRPEPGREVTPADRPLAQAPPAAEAPATVTPPVTQPSPVPQPTSSAPAPQQQAPPVVAPSASAPVTPAAVPDAPPDPRPQIEALVAAYARAIESRNVAEIRRYYPGLTGQQEQNWQRFFGSIRGVTAQLDISRLDVTGATATFAVTGRYDFEYNAGGGGPQHQAVSFQATAAQAGSAWRLTAVR